MNLILFGFKSVGKTTVGKMLAVQTGLPFIDFDTCIEKRYGLPCREIVLTKGEPAFRAMEVEMLHELRHVDNHIIALGGGTLIPEQNRTILKGTYVYLVASKETLKKRVLTPPLPSFIKDEADFEKIYCHRIAEYEKIPAIRLDLEMYN